MQSLLVDLKLPLGNDFFLGDPLSAPLTAVFPEGLFCSYPLDALKYHKFIFKLCGSICRVASLCCVFPFAPPCCGL